MKLWSGLIISLCGVLTGGNQIFAASISEWHELQSLTAIVKASDSQGDFKNAALIAERCVALSESIKHPNAKQSSDYYCALYLSSALRNGKGLPRDQGRAFAILKKLVASYPDDDAALLLAEAYLDGSGTSRDVIEAAEILWRMQHGAFSIYSDYWGMCNNCEGLWLHEKTVAHRIDQELTKHEKILAVSLAEKRFPDTAARIQHRDREIAAGTVLPATAFGGLFCLQRWRVRRKRPS